MLNWYHWCLYRVAVCLGYATHLGCAPELVQNKYIFYANDKDHDDEDMKFKKAFDVKQQWSDEYDDQAMKLFMEI